MRALVLIAALALSACGARPSEADGDHTAIWRDPSTGCNYLMFRNGFGQSAIGSLSIRFRADGKPDCPGSTDADPINPADFPMQSPVAGESR